MGLHDELMKNAPLTARRSLIFSKILQMGFIIGILGGCAKNNEDAAWKKYYDYVNDAQISGKDLTADVLLKIDKIAEEKSTTDRARAYADCSVALAKYGRDHCNWLDGWDSTRNGIDDDIGRGVSEWHEHYAYMRRQPPKPMFGKIVESRMSELEKGLTRDQFARAYADVSVILDRYLTVQTKNN
jgi:hypothetical protein